MNTLGTTALLGATLTTAMVAGLLFCFAHLVMPGLATLDDRAYLTAFQRIDAAIPNPWMMLTFVGSLVLTLGALVIHLTTDSPAVQAAAPQFPEAAGLRSRFESRWVRWNVVRTVTSVGALAALAGALFGSGRSGG